LLLFVMIPAAAGLAFLGRPIIAALFEWRNFTPESTQLTVRALWFYAPGMVAFSLGKVFVPAFYALQDTRTPVRIGVWTVAANIALSIIFMRTWPMYYKHAGIALATVLAETANGVVLARLLHRRLGSPGWGGIARSAARTLLGALLMGSAARACCAGLTEVLRRAGAADKLAQLAALVAAIGVGLLVYVLYAHFTRAPEWDALRAALRRRKKTP